MAWPSLVNNLRTLFSSASKSASCSLVTPKCPAPKGHHLCRRPHNVSNHDAPCVIRTFGHAWMCFRSVWSDIRYPRSFALSYLPCSSSSRRFYTQLHDILVCQSMLFETCRISFSRHHLGDTAILSPSSAITDIEHSLLGSRDCCSSNSLGRHAPWQRSMSA